MAKGFIKNDFWYKCKLLLSSVSIVPIMNKIQLKQK